jgi:hypothetical protein
MIFLSAWRRQRQVDIARQVCYNVVHFVLNAIACNNEAQSAFHPSLAL